MRLTTQYCGTTTTERREYAPTPAKLDTTQPKYRLHRATGQALVTLVDAHSGRRADKYLGVDDNPESRARYHNLIAKWEKNERRLDEPAGPTPTVAGITARSALSGFETYIIPLFSPTYAVSITTSVSFL